MSAELRGVATGVSLLAILVLVLLDVRLPVPGIELLQTLRFHLAAVMLVLPVLLLVTGAWRRALGMLLLIAASASLGGVAVAEQLLRRNPYESAAPLASLTVLSFNVLASNTEGDRIASYISAQQPDIAIILEGQGMAAALPDLQAQYPDRIGCAAPDRCDSVMLSRLPVIDQQIYPLGPTRRDRLIVARVDVNGHALTVLALHLSKPYFDAWGWIELTEIRSLLWDIEGPVLLAGDFNSAAWSYSVARFARQMRLAPPPGFPATWPVELGPLGVPIDNMFSRDGAIIRSIAAVDDPMGSNHRGLLAEVDIVQSVP